MGGQSFAGTVDLLGGLTACEVRFDEHQDAEIVEEPDGDEVISDEVEGIEEIGERAEDEQAAGAGGFFEERFEFGDQLGEEGGDDDVR